MWRRRSTRSARFVVYEATSKALNAPTAKLMNVDAIHSQVLRCFGLLRGVPTKRQPQSAPALKPAGRNFCGHDCSSPSAKSRWQLGDTETSMDVVKQLTDIALSTTPPDYARWRCRRSGAYLVATGQPREALAPLRDACLDWQSMSAPHACAGVRLVVGARAARTRR